MSTVLFRKPLLGVALATAILLLVPAVTMQFTPEVSWGPGDFVVAGVLIFGAGALAVLGVKQVSGIGGRITVILGIAVALGLVWAELAVGLFN